jgi:hypothetical protein
MCAVIRTCVARGLSKTLKPDNNQITAIWLVYFTDSKIARRAALELVFWLTWVRPV